jgi:hypothetical protein
VVGVPSRREAEIQPGGHDGRANPLPPPAVRSSRRSARSSAMFVLIALASTVAFGTWLNEGKEHSAPAPPTNALSTEPDGSVNELRKAERYAAQADAICTAASARAEAATAELLTPGTQVEAAWSETAARASSEALAELRALHPPEDSAVIELLSLMEQQTNVLSRVAVAASAGDTERVRRLSHERIRLTHQKDGVAYGLARMWGVSPSRLQGCPVRLPA